MEERNKIIVGALKECGSRSSIEEIFNLHDISGKEERVGLLNECMGNPQTFFSQEHVSENDRYELTIQMFLTKSWKLRAYYERMGIGV